MDLELDPRDLIRVAEVARAAPGTGIAALAALGGLDPARDFAGLDLRGWPLAGEDLRGFDLSGADLRDTGVEDALFDDTTVFDGARLDRRAQHLIGFGSDGVRRGRQTPETYTMVRIPDLSDAELLERRFVVADPLVLQGLTYAAPPTDQWLTYEGRYDVDPSVVCAFGHRHKKGYVFRDELERRYLVGNSCGAKHLGMGSWKVFAKGRELLEERASYLRDLRDLHDLFARNRDWISSLDAHPAIRTFDATMTVLQGRHPELAEAVRGVAAADGRLSLSVEERDFAAEEKVREQQTKDAERRGAPPPTERPVRTRRVLRDAGVLRGRSIFTARTTLRSQLGVLVRIVDAFLARKPATTRGDLLATTRNARIQVDKLFAVIEAADDFVAFFDPANVHLFARWAEEGRYDGCHFSVEGQSVLVRGPQGVLTTLARPPYPIARSPEMDDMSSAATVWGKPVPRSRRRTPS